MPETRSYTFRQRFVFPVLIQLFVMAFSYFAYHQSVRIEHEGVRIFIATLFGATYFVSIALGTLFVYTVAQVRGASMKERIIVSLVCPLIWAMKECLVLTESHPVIECLYWYLNPLNIWLAIFMAMEMGAATLLARKILQRRGENVRVVTAGPVLVVVGFLAAGILVYAWGKGENVYVLFLSGYRLLFGAGI